LKEPNQRPLSTPRDSVDDERTQRPYINTAT
jgi:hypothetical protein